MDLADYIYQNAEIVAVALYLLGLLLKATPRVPDWVIPYALGVVGIIMCNLILGWSVESCVQGVLVTGAAVLAHQLGKQGSEAVAEIKSTLSKKK